MFVSACFWMNSVESAVTLCATSWRFSLRRVAVTMTGSRRVAAGAGVSCAMACDAG